MVEQILETGARCLGQGRGRRETTRTEDMRQEQEWKEGRDAARRGYEERRGAADDAERQPYRHGPDGGAGAQAVGWARPAPRYAGQGEAEPEGPVSAPAPEIRSAEERAVAVEPPAAGARKDAPGRAAPPRER
ncbi:hypothetical protein B1992_08915 [Pseudoxanthomonas broegbernensis]|uniref:Uncharacterized protein n=1 Tax=Pseudoxanthomonas broegbernensis TaxID=83619 RepID=A0A7V8GM80_9GAMM|nr:hypothetical protein [Pseudoxanthomonas broegbernensis]KAF1686333.1 hypothetical protein B1992_08915 [Pseudoxanthomonas broegbernensis]MBB6064021.1 hypothetical protein [Pseudoxanthomonas broegbernensis]